MAIKTYTAKKSITGISVGGIQGGAPTMGSSSSSSLGASLLSLSSTLLDASKKRDMNKAAGALATTVKDNINDVEFKQKYEADQINFKQAYLDGNLKQEFASSTLSKAFPDYNKYNDEDLMSILGTSNTLGNTYITAYNNDQAQYHLDYTDDFTDIDPSTNLAAYTQQMKDTQTVSGTKFKSIYPQSYILGEKAKYDSLRGQQKGMYLKQKEMELGGVEEASDFFKELDLPLIDQLGLGMLPDQQNLFFEAEKINVDAMLGGDKEIDGLGKDDIETAAEALIEDFADALSGGDPFYKGMVKTELQDRIVKMGILQHNLSGQDITTAMETAFNSLKGGKEIIGTSDIDGVKIIVDQNFEVGGQRLQADTIKNNLLNIKQIPSVNAMLQEYIFSVYNPQVFESMSDSPLDDADKRRETLRLVEEELVLRNAPDGREGIQIFVNTPFGAQPWLDVDGSDIVIPWELLNDPNELSIKPEGDIYGVWPFRKSEAERDKIRQAKFANTHKWMNSTE